MNINAVHDFAAHPVFGEQVVAFHAIGTKCFFDDVSNV